ncbi:MAG: glycosyltransferase family 87 protein [Bdellovibrionales bacterium]
MLPTLMRKGLTKKSGLSLPAPFNRVEVPFFTFSLYFLCLVRFFDTKIFKEIASGHYPWRDDFANIWLASNLIKAGKVALAYDVSLFDQIGRLLHPLVPSMWNYPPLCFLFIWPFAFFPYGFSEILWAILGFSLFFLSAVKFLPLPFWPLFGVLLLSPACIENIRMGQNGFFSAALLITGLRLLNARPYASGACFGMMVFKPQLLLMAPFLLLITKAGRVIFTASLTALGLVGLSLALYGTEPWVSFFTTSIPLTKLLVFLVPHSVATIFNPSVFAAFRLTGASFPISMTAQILTFLLVVLAVLYTFKKTSDPFLRMGVLAPATLLASPYVMLYDTPLLTVGILAFLLGTPKPSFWQKGVAVVAWFAPTFIQPLNAIHIPLAPLAFLGFLAAALISVIKAPRSA